MLRQRRDRAECGLDPKAGVCILFGLAVSELTFAQQELPLGAAETGGIYETKQSPPLANRFLRSDAAVESIRKQIEGHTTIREKVSTSVDPAAEP